MKIFAILLCGWLASSSCLWAEDEDDTDGAIPLYHYPADFQLWGKAVNGVEISVAAKPFSTSGLPHRLYFFSVCIRNTSTQPVYFAETGNSPIPSRIVQIKIHDKNNTSAPLQAIRSYPKAQITVRPIHPQQTLVYHVSIDRDGFSAIGNNEITVLAEIMDKPSRQDPATQKFTVESLPIKVYPLGPDRTPLPADPLRAQLELKATHLKEVMNQTTDPGDHTDAAEALINCYLSMGKFNEALAVAPEATELPTKCDVEYNLTLCNPALTDAQKIEKCRALQQEYAQYADRVRLLQRLIDRLQYQSDHPDLFE